MTCLNCKVKSGFEMYAFLVPSDSPSTASRDPLLSGCYTEQSDLKGDSFVRICLLSQEKTGTD